MRRKWFAPAGDGRPYSPFGIDCEGAATLFGRRSGWAGIYAVDPDEQTVQELAKANRDFWTVLDRVPTAPSQSRRRLVTRLREGRST